MKFKDLCNKLESVLQSGYFSVEAVFDRHRAGNKTLTFKLYVADWEDRALIEGATCAEVWDEFLRRDPKTGEPAVDKAEILALEEVD